MPDVTSPVTGAVFKQDPSFSLSNDKDAFDRGFLAQNYPSIGAVALPAMTAGTIHGIRARHPGGPITNLIFGAGGTPLVTGTAGQNFVAIYDPNTSNRLAVSNDLTAQLGALPGSSAPWVLPLSAPINLSAGIYDFCVLQNNTGLSATFIGVSLQTGQQNVGIGTKGMRFFTADTGAIAMPATLAAKNIGAKGYWIGWN